MPPNRIDSYGLDAAMAPKSKVFARQIFRTHDSWDKIWPLTSTVRWTREGPGTQVLYGDLGCARAPVVPGAQAQPENLESGPLVDTVGEGPSMRKSESVKM